MGVVDLKSIYDKDGTTDFLDAYNTALNETFVLPIIMAAIAVLASLAMEWRNVKAKNL